MPPYFPAWSILLSALLAATVHSGYGRADADMGQSQHCQLNALEYSILGLGAHSEFYNGDPSSALRCIPSEDAAEALALNGIYRLDALEKVEVDGQVWYKVETYASPRREGWIEESSFADQLIKSSSWTTFVLRIDESTSDFYTDQAILYELRGGETEDSLSIPTAYGSEATISTLTDHILDKVDLLIRYETRGRGNGNENENQNVNVNENENENENENVDVKNGDTVRYYQDLIAYANGKLIPLVFTDNLLIDSDTADVGEYIIYLPDRTDDGQVFLSPMREGSSRRSAEQRFEDRYRFTDEISVPIDQCIIRFYQLASHRGKLKKRITEVYHWNGTDIARMYGDEVEFGE